MQLKSFALELAMAILARCFKAL